MPRCGLSSDFCVWMPTHQVRAIYKQRLDEVTMLERHIIQARARDLAETEHATKQTTLNVLETPVKLPPGRCEGCPPASLCFPIGRAGYRCDSQPVQNHSSVFGLSKLPAVNSPSQRLDISVTLVPDHRPHLDSTNHPPCLPLL